MEIRITRAKNCKTFITPGYFWKWLYYTNVNVGGYDSLVSLKAYLKIKYNNIKLNFVYAWK